MMNSINKVYFTKIMKVSFLFRLSSLILLLLLSSCQRSLTPLKLLVMPIDTVENTKATYAPFISYLEESINRKVHLVTPSSYAEVKEILLSDSTYDIVNLNGVLFSQYFDPQRYHIFAQETSGGETSYNSVFITRLNSNINEIPDLKGSLIAFNNKYSTSGALVPVMMLYKAGLYPNIDYNYHFLNSHLASAQSVISGDSDAAAVSWKTFKKFIIDKKINPSSLRIIGVSFPIPLDPWLLDKNLSDELKYQISSAFYELSQRFVLNSLGSDGFVPATKKTFTSLTVEDSKLFRTFLAE